MTDEINNPMFSGSPVEIMRARFDHYDGLEIVNEFEDDNGNVVFKISADHHDAPVSLAADELNDYVRVCADISLVSYQAADYYFVEVRQ